MSQRLTRDRVINWPRPSDQTFLKANFNLLYFDNFERLETGDVKSVPCFKVYNSLNII